MPNPQLAVAEAGSTDKQTLQNLLDTVAKYRKELQYLLSHLDDDNMGTITAKSIDTSTLVVGENILMGPGAALGWEQIEGAPNVTYIDADGIYTGTITADQIFGTAITGLTIQTAPAGYNRIVMSEDGIQTYNAADQKNGPSMYVGSGTTHALSMWYQNDRKGDFFYDSGSTRMWLGSRGVPLKIFAGWSYEQNMSISAANGYLEGDWHLNGHHLLTDNMGYATEDFCYSTFLEGTDWLFIGWYPGDGLYAMLGDGAGGWDTLGKIMFEP